jgi:hypothetical protein
MVGSPPAGSVVTLRAALRFLDRRLGEAVAALRSEVAARAEDPLRGLYVSDDDVDTLLDTDSDAELDGAAPAAASFPRLARLANLFGLNPVEQEAVLLCLAPEIDLRYERLYAYLQDDLTRRRPTVDLLLRTVALDDAGPLGARAALSPGGRLFTTGLLLAVDEPGASGPWLGRTLRLDERVVEYLVGLDRPDARLAGCVTLDAPLAESGGPDLPEAVPAGLARVLATGGNATIYLHGASAAARRATVRAACRVAGRPLLTVDGPALLELERPAAALALIGREARLQEAALAFDGIDRLLTDDPALHGLRSQLRGLLAARPDPTVLLGERWWEPAAWLAGSPALRIQLPPLPPTARADAWRRQVGDQLPAETVAELAGRFRLDDAAVTAVVATARLHAVWRGGDAAGAEDVRAAARAVATPPLGHLAQRLEPRYDWDDIVLPGDSLAQLRELCSRARYQGTVLTQWGFGRKHVRRFGLTALFAGPPGTGKTMAAEIVARNLGLAIYRIELAALVSKYIGETEKNLEQVFRAADQGDAVLLFDEADAIFGKRSEVRDAHDRYANVETAYLLQRLETFEGVAILTTNLRGNLDEAFVRRLDFALEFPLPEEPERAAIWRHALPDEAPLATDVDLPFLARKFRLSGGHIRNIALTAAFLAAADGGEIGMAHLVRATRREHQKLGKLISEGDFGPYYGLLRES